MSSHPEFEGNSHESKHFGLGIVSEMGVERHVLPRLLSYFGCVRLVMNSRIAG